jgi:hypothetical protein
MNEVNIADGNYKENESKVFQFINFAGVMYDLKTDYPKILKEMLEVPKEDIKIAYDNIVKFNQDLEVKVAEIKAMSKEEAKAAYKALIESGQTLAMAKQNLK